MNIGIHITHEAAKKIGGIGSVLSGICTAKTYLKSFNRTIFYGPLFDDRSNPNHEESIAKERLGGNAKVLFSSLDYINDTKYGSFFEELIRKYNIDIIYGEKVLYDEIDVKKNNVVEILLIGVKYMNKELLDVFKFQLWESFRFSCQPFENDWDFEQYLRIGVPFREITDRFFDEPTKKDTKAIYFSHEYMGIGSCLAITLKKKPHEQTYFHAHEISTARAVTEKLTCHDIAFYNYLERDLKNNISLEERFGSHKQFSRNELIKLTPHFDGVLAVGDWVKKEYKYVVPNSDSKKVHICYNGIPTPNHSFEEKVKARKKLQEYCENLYNFTPDVIMTHVTRLVVSKGLWRDINMCEELDKQFRKDKKKGFFVILSSLIGNGRTDSEAAGMEKEYGWPVLHKEGYPDLLEYEKEIWERVQLFNAKSKWIKAVFINQFGFTPNRVGERLPKNTTFADFRLASDIEFGMSVYEPFGIAQIETIPFGGIAVLTRVCGSAFLIEKAFAGEKKKPFYIVDFHYNSTKEDITSKDLINESAEYRVTLEREKLAECANKIYKTIPVNDEERKEILEVCKKNMHKLSWEEVVKDLPFLK
ncbi:MAG: hypothetical protein FWG20_06805 [Candidatus Cloacimonetes bacterium]|nr:hypothetical protein [Candidatus Cloacimonadota bacterium]